MLLLLSGVGEGGTATRVGRRKDLVGEESVLTDNIPIGANEAPSLGLLGEESLLDLILQNSDMLGWPSFSFTWGKLLVLDGWAEDLRQDLAAKPQNSKNQKLCP